MDETPKITERQRGLLLVLPDQPGDGKLTPLEDAPGSYVRVKAQD